MSENQRAFTHFGVPGMRWGQRRRISAIVANKRDVADLRSHGMKKEAAAVEKVGAKIQTKLIKADTKTVLKLNRKADLAVGANLMSTKNGKTKIRKDLAIKNYNDFVKSRESVLGKAYVTALFKKANEGRN